MVRFQRRARVKLGKTAEAVSWAKEIAQHLGTSGSSVLVLHEVLDDVSALYWHADYNALADLEQTRNNLLQDTAYQKLIAKAGDLLVEGTLEDTLLAPA